MATFHEIKTDDQDDPWNGLGLPPGIPKAVAALLGALIILAMPYLIPADRCLTLHDAWEPVCAGDLRLWTEEDPTPFATLFSTDGVGPQVAEASGGNVVTSTEPLVEGVDVAALTTSESPGSEGPTIGLVDVGDPGADPEPKPVSPASADAGTTEPAPEPGDKAPEAKRIKIPAELTAAKVKIEDPKGAMRPFYAALAKTALKKEGAVTRITHWGDSGIGADGPTSAGRHLLQRNFGDAGHGWILVESGSDWYKHKDIRYDSGGWKALKIIDGAARDGRYGVGGVSARGYLGANATFGTVKKDDAPVGKKVSRIELHYLSAWKHGNLELRIDEGEPIELSTGREEGAEDAVWVHEVPDGPHVFRMRVTGGGPVRVYGVVFERAGPGVVYDSIGLVGARASRLLNADPEHWKTQLANRRPDLMIIQYGGNELTDRNMSMTKYRETFTEVVRRFRTSRPEASCLVMSPTDKGKRGRGGIITDPLLLELMPIQREVALSEGCAFFDLFQAMGGEGSMGRWARAKPRLGWGDLAHVTPAGSKILADLFFKALMAGLSDYIDEL